MHARFPKHTFLRSPSRHMLPRFLNLSRTALDLASIQLTRPTAPPRSLRRPGRCTAPTWFLTRGCRRSLRGQAVALAVHGHCCRCLNLSTSMGGTHSKVEGGDRHDLEPEGTREDTRHKIYTGSGSRSNYPTSCLE
jgi:hypothetical protein